MAGAAAAEGPQKGKNRHHFLVGVALTIGLVTLLALFSHRGLYRIYRLSQERQTLDQETARLAAENSRLARTIDRLQHDPEMIQDLIRRELNLVRKNDIIIQLPQAAGKNQAQGPPRLQVGSRRPQPGAGGKDDRARSLSGAPQRAPGTGALRRGDAPAGRNLLSTGPVSPGSDGQPPGSFPVP